MVRTRAARAALPSDSRATNPPRRRCSGSCSAMASAVNVAAVDRLAALIEPLWGQYAFLHSLIESRLHCFFDLIPHPVRVRVELGLHSLPLLVVRQHVYPRP